MTQWFTLAFGGGLLSAVLYAAILGGSFGAMVLAYLTPLPLFLVGLGLGAQPGLMAAVTASVLVLGITGSPLGSFLFAIGNALPVWLMVRQVLLSRETEAAVEWYPPGPLLLLLTGFGAGAVGLAFLAALAVPGGLEGAVGELIVESLRQMQADGLPFTESDRQNVADALAPVFPGGVAVSWLAMLIVNGLLAQGLLLRFERAVRPGMSLRDLALPDWAVMPLMAATAGAVLVSGPLGYLSLNLAVVLVVPFFFSGLAVIHAFADAQTARIPLLVAFYLLVFLFGWPVLMVVGVGLVDQWLKLRRRTFVVGAGRRDE